MQWSKSALLEEMFCLLNCSRALALCYAALMFVDTPVTGFPSKIKWSLLGVFFLNSECETPARPFKQHQVFCVKMWRRRNIVCVYAMTKMTFPDLVFCLSLSRLSSAIIKYDTANESYQTTILSSSLTKMYFLLLVKSCLYIMLLSNSIIALFYLLCMCITNTNKTYPLLIYIVNEVPASVKTKTEWMRKCGQCDYYEMSL